MIKGVKNMSKKTKMVSEEMLEELQESWVNGNVITVVNEVKLMSTLDACRFMQRLANNQHKRFISLMSALSKCNN